MMKMGMERKGEKRINEVRVDWQIKKGMEERYKSVIPLPGAAEVRLKEQKGGSLSNHDMKE